MGLVIVFLRPLASDFAEEAVQGNTAQAALKKAVLERMPRGMAGDKAPHGQKRRNGCPEARCFKGSKNLSPNYMGDYGPETPRGINVLSFKI